MLNNYLRTRIKICGLTRCQDVIDAVNLGADSIGMVFYPASKRFIDLPQAQQLRQLIPAFVSCTALFVNPESEFVNSVINTVKPDFLQFHGDESADFCNSFNHPYIKAFRVGAPLQDSAESLLKFCANYDQAKAWLFDSYTPAYGGSGKSFDLDLLSLVSQMPNRPVIILSGGLTAETVGDKIKACQPFAVDASSAVELSPGVKDKQKICEFIKAVQKAHNIVK